MLYLILFFLLSFYLKYKTFKHQKLQELHNQSVNLSQELMLIEEEKNRSILENQDYEINIATLNERNRISKEIHDHIGHVLSRSLIQIGALLTLEQNPFIKDELSNLKTSLSEGMDSIRASIHNMHDESIDLYSTVKNLIDDFQFCTTQYHYDIVNTPLLKVKYCFIAIVKEALSNIMKHSDAKNVIIVLAEEPALYRLIIDDNGTVTEKTKALARKIQLTIDSTDGLGLHNMHERVKGLNGTFQIIANNGFKILVAIPKEKTEVIHNEPNSNRSS
ncbi:sensor histidine kinase [[Clostridium] polysaccharolyticum]|nr:histidine kinase [[Clostridium] polysaccharolyticum]